METLFWGTLVVILAVSNAAEWGYHGSNGPEFWKNDYPFCGDKSQSPINFDTNDMDYDEALTPLTLTNYDQSDANKNYTVINNGHTVQINFDDTDFNLNGVGFGSNYKAAQLHFHWGATNNNGSEHTLNDVHYAMEVHIVHYNTALGNLSNAVNKPKGLAVLGFFFVVGDTDNPNYDSILDSLSGTVKNATGVDKAEGKVPAFSLKSIIPDMNHLEKYFRYQGSLTTPACHESVIWTVFESTIPISNIQMNKFRQILDHEGKPILDNYRHVQNLNGRRVSTSDVNYKQTNSASTVTFGMSLIATCLAVFELIL